MEDLKNIWMISVLAINGTNLLFTVIIPLTTWLLVKFRVKKDIKSINLKKQIDQCDLEIKKIQLQKLQTEIKQLNNQDKPKKTKIN